MISADFDSGSTAPSPAALVGVGAVDVKLHPPLSSLGVGIQALIAPLVDLVWTEEWGVEL